MEKFQLGPVQKNWVNALREHPVRQIEGKLGKLEDDNSWSLCCLGQGLLCLLDAKGVKPILFAGRDLIDAGTSYIKGDRDSSSCLANSYKDLGLKERAGAFLSDTGEAVTVEGGYYSLVSMNDGTYKGNYNYPSKTWPQIADFIENNGHLIFDKSV